MFEGKRREKGPGQKPGRISNMIRAAALGAGIIGGVGASTGVEAEEHMPEEYVNTRPVPERYRVDGLLNLYGRPDLQGGNTIQTYVERRYRGASYEHKAQATLASSLEQVGDEFKDEAGNRCRLMRITGLVINGMKVPPQTYVEYLAPNGKWLEKDE